MLSFLQTVLTQTASDLVVGEPVQSPAQALLAQILVPLVTVVGSVLALLLTALANHFRQLAKTNKLFAALAVGTELINTGVAHAETELKPSFAANPNMTPAQVGAATKAALLDTLKTTMPAEVTKTLAKGLGDSINSWTSGKVEQAVAAQAVDATAPAPVGPK